MVERLLHFCVPRGVRWTSVLCQAVLFVALVETTRGLEYAMELRAIGLGMLWLLFWRNRRDLIACGLLTVTCFEPIGLGWILGFVAIAPVYVSLLLRPSSSVVPLSITLSAAQILVLTHWCTVHLEYSRAYEWGVFLIGVSLWVPTLWCARTLLAFRSRWLGFSGVLAIPLLEAVRAHTPGVLLPYHLLAHSVAESRYVVQSAELLGVIGLSSVLSLTSFLAACAYVNRTSSAVSARAAFACCLLLVAHLLSFGAVRLEVWQHDKGSRAIAITISQGQTPSTPPEELRARLIDAFSSSPADLVVLPENTLVDSVSSDITVEGISVNEAVSMLRARQPAAGLIAGVVRELDSGPDGVHRTRNALAASPPDGMPSLRDKRMIAAIGDRAPFDGIAFLDVFGRWLVGRESLPVVEDARGEVDLGFNRPIACCICIEHIVPMIWRMKPISERPEVQVCISDISLYGYSAHQLAQSRAARRIRAIEMRTAFVYSSNGGSEAFDAIGRMTHQLDPSVSHATWEVLPSGDEDVIMAIGRLTRPPFVFFPLVCVVCGLGVAAFRRIKQTRLRRI